MSATADHAMPQNQDGGNSMAYASEAEAYDDKANCVTVLGCAVGYAVQPSCLVFHSVPDEDNRYRLKRGRIC